MTRLAATEKGQFFPTPLIVAETIAALLAPEKGATIYDPCAGEGEAVARIAELAGLTAYGNELDAARAAVAAERLAQCTVGPYEAVERTGSPFSAVFLNPPYAASVGSRLEMRALPHALNHLAARGAFFALVPLDAVCDFAFLQRVHAVCDIRGVARFPGETFEPYKQVVLWGVRRGQGVMAAETALDVQRRFSLTYAQWNPKALPEFTPALVAEVAPIELPGRRTDVVLTNAMANPEALMARAHAAGATTTPTFRAITQGIGSRAVAPFRPLLPLKRGHAAEMLAAGFLDGGEVEWEGQAYLVRGHARRVVTERTEDTGETTYKVVKRERFATVVTLLNLVTGAITTLDMEHDRAQYERFLLAQADALTDLVQRRFPAIYDPSTAHVRDIDPAVAAALDAVRAPGALPGVGEKGLLPAQYDAAAALALSLRSGQKTVIGSGEMGVGKTLLGNAAWVASEGGRMATHAPKAVILCPAHLTKKWARQTIKSLAAFDVEAVIARKPSEVDAGFALPRPAVILLSRESAKMAAEWRHVGVCGHRREEQASLDDAGKPVTTTVLAPVVRCPDCGAVQMEMQEDEDSGEMIPVGTIRWLALDGRRTPMFGQNKRACQACQAPLWQQVAFKTRRVGRHLPPTGAARVFGQGPAFGGGRVALAEYISQHYAGRYTLIADELHQYKGAATDLGYCLSDLVSGARKVIGLTGTIYGGKASTLFHLGYRLLNKFRDEFSHDAELSFVHAFGLMETVEYRSKDGADRTSCFGYNRKADVRKKEIPGAQPDMIALLLPHTVFLELADLGVALPAYEELQVGAALPPSVADVVQAMEDFGDTAATAARTGDTSMLSSYLQLSLGWPYRMEGAEEIIHNRTEQIVFSTPGIAVPPGGWPLDRLFVQFCRDEKAQGRRVLGYLQQMIKRDASPRLVRLLEAAGLSVAVLRPTVDPEEREAWVAAQVEAGVDVLFTNPQLVETGLDLVSFASVAHLGTDYSTYRLRQSSRRSWRLGQTQPVKVVWFYYENTESHRAMPLIAKKLKAAQHVDGRLAEGLAASVGDEDGDLMSALIRQVLTGRVMAGPAFPILTITLDEDASAVTDEARGAERVSATPEEDGTQVPAADPRWHLQPATQASLFDALFAA